MREVVTVGQGSGGSLRTAFALAAPHENDDTATGHNVSEEVTCFI